MRGFQASRAPRGISSDFDRRPRRRGAFKSARSTARATSVSSEAGRACFARSVPGRKRVRRSARAAVARGRARARLRAHPLHPHIWFAPHPGVTYGAQLVHARLIGGSLRSGGRRRRPAAHRPGELRAATRASARGCALHCPHFKFVGPFPALFARSSAGSRLSRWTAVRAAARFGVRAVYAPRVWLKPDSAAAHSFQDAA